MLTMWTTSVSADMSFQTHDPTLQPNPIKTKLSTHSQSNPTQPSPTRGKTQSMDNSVLTEKQRKNRAPIIPHNIRTLTLA